MMEYAKVSDFGGSGWLCSTMYTPIKRPTVQATPAANTVDTTATERFIIIDHLDGPFNDFCGLDVVCRGRIWNLMPRNESFVSCVLFVAYINFTIRLACCSGTCLIIMHITWGSVRRKIYAFEICDKHGMTNLLPALGA